MFLGHFAVGLALKKSEPRIPLGIWFAAGQFLDILWPVFLLTGIESVSVVPGITRMTPLDLKILDWSHSLAMVMLWSVGFGAVCWWFLRSREAFIYPAIAVASHWLLDFASHRPDMPLWPHSERVGLGLWNSIPGTLVAELGLLAVGLWLYLRDHKFGSAARRINFILIIALLLLIYTGSAFGPPPPNDSQAIALSTLILLPIIILWSDWADGKSKV